MEADSGMVLEELADSLGFVRREIVADDVNLLPRWAQGYDLLQKGDQLPTGMANSGFAVHTTGGGNIPTPSFRDLAAQVFTS